MSKPNSTAEHLRECLHYSPQTGDITWKLPPNKRIAAGAIAGTTRPDGYRQIGIAGKLYQAHRVAWCIYYGVWPTTEIDHINGMRADNRISNLREATHSQNMHNQQKAQRSNKSSGLLGVHRTRTRWVAGIKVNGVRIYLGTFTSPEDACAAYEHAKHLYFPLTI